ncbi:hypothetical protein [Frigidibacter mobilis]|uniref:FlgN protein n=1 Tax=Frigidibacter mobilis TaxID=1335048 RepID=A0A159Z001_9RHOB|nr:hypothetical protein [Frigidibacter mobilis]AMY68057.1 hypothetical protein AKL17_0798 [Frigidibacter mobilis]
MADVTQMLHRLGRLLDDEAQAIRAGDLQTLALLPLEKAALVSAVEACAQGPQPAQPGEAEMLTRLRQQATVNQQLLGATLKGMRSALLRLDALRRAGRSLQSYDATGRPQVIDTPRSSLERRA